MSPVDTALSPATQASLLLHVASHDHMRIALPSVAHHFHTTLEVVQAICNRNGYPDKAVMTRNAKRLQTPQEPAADTPAAAGEPAPDTYRPVKVADLHSDPNNPRDDASDDIEDLASSMNEVGLLQPIVARVHQGKLVVVAGHRRLAAARYLSWADVPCIVKDSMRPDHVLAAMLIENGQRRDLDPIEEARGLRKLKAETDCNDLDLARKIGRSQSHVSSRLALLSLSAEEQDEVRRGSMTLIEASHKGRLNSGKIRPQGNTTTWHLSPEHELADKAKARCVRLKHKRGRTVGGMACGACWESVIRADERDHLHKHSAKTGSCTICGGLVEPTATSDEP